MNAESLIAAEHALVQAARESPLSDIIVTGFVDDSDNGKTFHPMMDRVYIRIGRALFMLWSASQHSLLAIQGVTDIKCEFDIDEDDEFCACSVMQIFLNAPFADSGVHSIDWFHAIASDGSATALKALGFSLDREEYIFFDPLNYFGIQIGGRERRNSWMAQNPNTTVMTSTIANSTSART